MAPFPEAPGPRGAAPGPPPEAPPRAPREPLLPPSIAASASAEGFSPAGADPAKKAIMTAAALPQPYEAEAAQNLICAPKSRAAVGDGDSGSDLTAAVLQPEPPVTQLPPALWSPARGPPPSPSAPAAAAAAAFLPAATFNRLLQLKLSIAHSRRLAGFSLLGVIVVLWGGSSFVLQRLFTRGDPRADYAKPIATTLLQISLNVCLLFPLLVSAVGRRTAGGNAAGGGASGSCCRTDRFPAPAPSFSPPSPFFSDLGSARGEGTPRRESAAGWRCIPDLWGAAAGGGGGGGDPPTMRFQAPQLAVPAAASSASARPPPFAPKASLLQPLLPERAAWPEGTRPPSEPPLFPSEGPTLAASEVAENAFGDACRTPAAPGANKVESFALAPGLLHAPETDCAEKARFWHHRRPPPLLLEVTALGLVWIAAQALNNLALTRLSVPTATTLSSTASFPVYALMVAAGLAELNLRVLGAIAVTCAGVAMLAEFHPRAVAHAAAPRDSVAGYALCLLAEIPYACFAVYLEYRAQAAPFDGAVAAAVLDEQGEVKLLTPVSCYVFRSPATDDAAGRAGGGSGAGGDDISGCGRPKARSSAHHYNSSTGGRRFADGRGRTTCSPDGCNPLLRPKDGGPPGPASRTGLICLQNEKKIRDSSQRRLPGAGSTVARALRMLASDGTAGRTAAAGADLVPASASRRSVRSVVAGAVGGNFLLLHFPPPSPQRPESAPPLPPRDVWRWPFGGRALLSPRGVFSAPSRAGTAVTGGSGARPPSGGWRRTPPPTAVPAGVASSEEPPDCRAASAPSSAAGSGRAAPAAAPGRSALFPWPPRPSQSAAEASPAQREENCLEPLEAEGDRMDFFALAAGPELAEAAQELPGKGPPEAALPDAALPDAAPSSPAPPRGAHRRSDTPQEPTDDPPPAVGPPPAPLPLTGGPPPSIVLPKTVFEEELEMSRVFGLVGLFALVSAPVLLLAARALRLESPALPPRRALAYIVLTGLLSGVLSNWLWGLTIVLLNPVVATLGLNAQIPLVLLIDNIYVAQHRFTVLYLMGSALIIAGVAAISVLTIAPPTQLAEEELPSLSPPVPGKTPDGRVCVVTC